MQMQPNAYQLGVSTAVETYFTRTQFWERVASVIREGTFDGSGWECILYRLFLNETNGITKEAIAKDTPTQNPDAVLGEGNVLGEA